MTFNQSYFQYLYRELREVDNCYFFFGFIPQRHSCHFDYGKLDHFWTLIWCNLYLEQNSVFLWWRVGTQENFFFSLLAIHNYPNYVIWIFLSCVLLHNLISGKKLLSIFFRKGEERENEIYIFLFHTKKKEAEEFFLRYDIGNSFVRII